MERQIMVDFRRLPAGRIMVVAAPKGDIPGSWSGRRNRPYIHAGGRAAECPGLGQSGRSPLLMGRPDYAETRHP